MLAAECLWLKRIKPTNPPDIHRRGVAHDGVDWYNCIRTNENSGKSLFGQVRNAEMFESAAFPRTSDKKPPK